MKYENDKSDNIKELIKVTILILTKIKNLKSA